MKNVENHDKAVFVVVVLFCFPFFKKIIAESIPMWLNGINCDLNLGPVPMCHSGISPPHGNTESKAHIAVYCPLHLNTKQTEEAVLILPTLI